MISIAFLAIWVIVLFAIRNLRAKSNYGWDGENSCTAGFILGLCVAMLFIVLDQ